MQISAALEFPHFRRVGLDGLRGSLPTPWPDPATPHKTPPRKPPLPAHRIRVMEEKLGGN